ncbi:MAG: HAMP domain-containing histidine kinase [Clostridia bacterium]|nr:HAMP domain-containing histidine kinase [Clostridia bacterium]
MSKPTHENKQEQKGKKIKSSLVYKLNTRLLLRMLEVFIVIDLFLCLAFGATTLLRTEKMLAKTIQFIEEYGLPDYKTSVWLEADGYRVVKLAQNPKGFTVPKSLYPFLPEETQSGARTYRFDTENDFSFLEKAEYLIFEYEYSSDGQTYQIITDFGPFVIALKQVLSVLFLLQLIFLFGSIFSGAHLIRKTLHPIVVLAQTARDLNIGNADFDIEKMEHLAIKLNSINAAKLDTRISVDETEHELQGLAAAINSMLDRINESYRAQIRFVSDASHELRTPISVIEGYANLLDRWGKNDEKTLEESIHAIKEEAASMKSLVEQLLFLARGDSNTMHLQLETFDLSVLVQEILRETRMIDSGHDFSATVESVSIYADKGLIKQALRILMDNAIKYTNAGGMISISVAEKESFVFLTVQDEGIGIPPEAVSHVFDRFFRADESRAKSTGGTGLGLSIARWISERHGGHMEVLSRQDFGTRISIVIPKNFDKNADKLTENTKK